MPYSYMPFHAHTKWSVLSRYRQIHFSGKHPHAATFSAQDPKIAAVAQAKGLTPPLTSYICTSG